jgi:hypothetical protein
MTNEILKVVIYIVKGQNHPHRPLEQLASQMTAMEGFTNDKGLI